MKKLLLSLLACSVSSVYATELKSFQEIYNSIQAGHNIRMIIHFDKCSPKPPIANLVAYTAPTAIMMKEDSLQFANSPLTTNNPKFLHKPVLENCTYKMTASNEINIVTRVITLPDYVVASEIYSVCPFEAVSVYN